MGQARHLLCLVFGCLCCLVPRYCGQATVEGFVGNQVTLPCPGVRRQSDLYWYKVHPFDSRLPRETIMVRLGSGVPIVPPEARAVWEGQISIVNAADLRINSLDADRDRGVFTCRNIRYSNEVSSNVVILARVTGATVWGPQYGVVSNVTLSADQSIWLSCDVTGDPTPLPQYTWKIGDESLISGRDTSTYNLIADWTMNGKIISCTATNYYRNGTKLSSMEGTATLNITYISPVSITPSSVTVVEGGTFTLTCAADGNPSVILKWKKAGVLLGTSSLYSKSSVQRSDAGEYECQASNSLIEKSTNVTVIVHFISPVSITPSSVTVAEGGTFTLICSASGNPSVMLKWEKSGVLLGMSSSYSKSSVQRPDAGEYECQANNSLIERSAKATVVVYFISLVSITPSAVTVVEGGIFTLTCSANGNASVMFKWKKSGDLLGTSSSYSKSSVQRSDAGEYECQASNSLIEKSAKVTVVVYSRVTGATIGGPQGGVATMVTVSAGQSIRLSCDVTGVPYPLPKYTWKIDDQSLVGGPDTNTYDIFANETMNGKTISCTATNYYSNGKEISSEDGTATLNVTFMGPVNITLPSVTMIEGDTLTLTCAADGNPSVILKWKKSGELIETSSSYIKSRVQRSDAGEYECQASNGIMDKSANVTVVVFSKIKGASILESENGHVTISTGKALALTCTVTGDPDPSPVYVWRIGDITTPVIADTRGHSFTADQNMHRKTITCTAVNYYGDTRISSAEASVKLNVTFLGAVTLRSNPSTVTENDTVTIQCRSAANPPASFEWRKGGTILESSSVYTLKRVLRTDAGDYTCHAFNIEGNKTGNTNLRVLFPPNVSVTYNSTTRTLMCTAEGVPDNYTFSPWEQRINGQLIRKIPGTTANYTFVWSSSMGYKDTGNYTCAVTNGIGQIQRKQMLVRSEVSPVFDYTTQRSVTISMNNPEVIAISFYSHPMYTKVEWWKATPNETLQNHKEEPEIVILLVYDKTANFRGFTSVLSLADASPEDEGNYTITVYNVVNGATQTAELTVYVNISDISDTNGDNDIVGPTVGGVTSVLVIVILVTVFVVWYRRRNTGDKPNNRIQRSLNTARSATDDDITDIGENNHSAETTVPTYEGLQRAVSEVFYQNAEPNQHYEKLQPHSRTETLVGEGPPPSAHPETPASNYQNVPMNPMMGNKITNESHQDTSHA